MNKDLWEKYNSNALNEGLSQKRIAKLKLMFDTISRGLGDLNKAQREDIEAFVDKLHKDKFTRLNGSPYSGSSKSDIKKFLKMFYKWLKGDNEVYPLEVRWIKTRIAKDEKPKEKEILSIKEVVKLSKSFKELEFKILTLLLFDSGFRISELLTAKKRNIKWEEYQDGKKCFWIECTESKTFPRKVPIPLFTDEIKAYLKSDIFQRLPDNMFLFNMSYSFLHNKFRDNAKRILNKHISPHSLRHSSATYYAKELEGNAMALAQRYGWAFNSKELQTYIRRSGTYQRATAQKVYSNEISKIKEENVNLSARLEKLEKFVESLMNEKKINKKLSS